jgi:hypothetical protein
VLQGTPGEVFAHAQQLQQMGLDLPEPAHIALLLRQQGVSVPEGIYTTEQLKQAILALWKGGAPC